MRRSAAAIAKEVAQMRGAPAGATVDDIIARYERPTGTVNPVAGTGYAPPVETNEPGWLESAMRGLAQGATLGFADEIGGALESAFTNKTYEQSRDESRAKYRQAQEANPWTYGLADVLGSVGTGVVTGGVAAPLRLGTLGAAGLAATEGALAGAGASEGKTFGEVAKDAAISGAVGGALGGAAHKVFGNYAARAPERFAKHVAEDVTAGTNMVNKRRFAKVQELAGDYFEKDPELRRALRDPNTAMDGVENRLAKLHQEKLPDYGILRETLPFEASRVTSAFDDELRAAAREPGKEAWAKLVKTTRDNFVSAVTRDAEKGADLRTVAVDPLVVRKWVSNLLDEADHTLGSLAETERSKLKNDIHALADGVLKDYMDDAAQKSKIAADAVADLRQVNKDITVLVKTKDALKPRLEKEMVGHQSLRDVLGSSGIPIVAGIAGAGGDIVAGGAAYAGAKVALSGLRGANRTATHALARLVKAVRAGDPAKEYAYEAIRAGVPLATVQGLLASARETPDGVKETISDFVIP